MGWISRQRRQYLIAAPHISQGSLAQASILPTLSAICPRKVEGTHSEEIVRRKTAAVPRVFILAQPFQDLLSILGRGKPRCSYSTTPRLISRIGRRHDAVRTHCAALRRARLSSSSEMPLTRHRTPGRFLPAPSHLICCVWLLLALPFRRRLVLTSDRCGSCRSAPCADATARLSSS